MKSIASDVRECNFRKFKRAADDEWVSALKETSKRTLDDTDGKEWWSKVKKKRVYVSRRVKGWREKKKRDPYISFQSYCWITIPIKSIKSTCRQFTICIITIRVYNIIIIHICFFVLLIYTRNLNVINIVTSY